MSRNESYIDKIEDFSNIELPDVDIYEEDKEKIKSNIVKILGDLKQKNSDDFKINVTQEQADELKNQLGKEVDDRVFGVRGSKFMKKIIEQTIQDELEGERIIKSIEYELPPVVFWGLSAIHNYAYITDKEFIWYNFDVNYKLVSKGRELLTSIKTVGRVRHDKTDSGGIEFFVRGEKFYFVLIIHGSEKVHEMDDFIGYIHDNYKAKLFDKNKFAKGEMIFYGITAVLVIIGLSYFFAQIGR